MKRYFDTQIIDAQIAADYGIEGYEKLCKKTGEELQKVYNYLFENSLTYQQERDNQLNTNIDEEFFTFIQHVFSICDETPLLETESTIQYPDLYSAKKRKDSEIYNFINAVYHSELPSHETDVVDTDNFKIFHPSFIKKIRVGAGNIVVYNDFMDDRRKMVLERFDNVRDLIFTAGRAVELIDRPLDSKYSNALNVMNYFMRSRSAKYLTGFEGDKQERIAFDNIIYGVRKYARAINDMTVEEFNSLNSSIKAELLDMVDRILGYSLARMNNISLQTLVDGNIMDGSGANLESIGTSYAEVENAFTQASDELKGHPYTIKK